MKPLLRTLFSLAMFFSFVLASWAVTSGVEYKFRGVPDGSQPNGGLVTDGAGNFYGTTSGGGRSECGFSTPFCGTVFKLSQSITGQWKETILYKFTGGADGGGPSGSLVFDVAGNLYGTTVSGGNLETCNQAGCGTVFKLSPNQNGTWTDTTLYDFLGNTDAEQPGTGVIFDTAGNLYGAAGGGCIVLCSGVIFKLSPKQDGTWSESIIYTFLGDTDGGFPNALTLDGKGHLFGTTFSGGASQPPCSCGTVFELTHSTSGQWTKQILYSFTDGLDGGFPSSGVTLDSAGNLYGETYDAGSFACPQSGCGVVYQLASVSGEWKLSLIHTFNGLDGSKGSQPTGGLTFDSEGNLYGTTSGGGNLTCNNGNGCGTIFKLSPKSGGGFAFSLVAAFNGTSGAGANYGVILDAGTLYGTTFSGGSSNCAPTGCGVAFAIVP
jgi:uncharacterized repeat protein (TIGR03803 family)